MKKLFSKTPLFTWRFRYQIKRWVCAINYLRHRLSEDDALFMIEECNSAAGTFPLVTLYADCVFSDAQDRFGDEAVRLKPHITPACRRVAGKWTDDGEHHGIAREWALDLAIDYAKADGIDVSQFDQYRMDELPLPN